MHTLAAATLATATTTATHDADEYVVHVQAQATTSMVTADGSASAPFKTIEAARDHLRAVRSASANGVKQRFRVSIGSGVYPPLELGAQDSGTPGREVVYEAARSVSGGPHSVISGGIEIPKSAFQPCVNRSVIVLLAATMSRFKHCSPSASLYRRMEYHLPSTARQRAVRLHSVSHDSHELRQNPPTSANKLLSAALTRLSFFRTHAMPGGTATPAS